MGITKKSTYDVISMRYKYYRKGQLLEKSHNYPDAIGAYLEYSQWLDDKDKHIPHLWISKLYELLNDLDKVFKHMRIYADGCSLVRSIDIWIEIGKKYEKLGYKQKALESYEIARSKNSKAPVRSRISALKRELK